MRIVAPSEFPRPVRAIENLWIPLADGTRLAARVWMPEDAGSRPVPAVLECLPYRKRDGLRYRDDRMHPYFAGHGYAMLRVDLRGTGDSEGLPDDEYSAAEHRDILDCIAWAATQDWCDGAIGMMGVSWGGFNSLQIAALAPPALKAIVTVDASDDRYNDDVHYMQGVMLHDNFAWASAMFAFVALPPDPEIFGAEWRAAWLARLRHYRFPFRIWGAHQRRDAYWRHGSVCEDYGAVKCPVLAIGGWEDGYSNAVPRLAARLTIPRRGWIGPWGHAFPHNGIPGPQAGFLQEALRWWDLWLKAEANGADGDPRLLVWMNDTYAPDPCAEERPGRWLGFADWPDPGIEKRRFFATPMGLRDREATGEWQGEIASPLSCGLGCVEWCGNSGGDGDIAGDQAQDDGLSLVFDTPPLSEPLAFVGAPELDLLCSVDRPIARIAVRLCEVAPDGRSTRITYGLFSLNHQPDPAEPKSLMPGARYRFRLRLNDAAHRFSPGHRLRLAISTNYWPQMMPAPEAVKLGVIAPGTSLVLPILPADRQIPPQREVPPALSAAPSPGEWLRPGATSRKVVRDLLTGETRLEMVKDAGAYRFAEIDLVSDCRQIETYSIQAGNPLSHRVAIEYRQELRRPGWAIRTFTQSRLSLTAETYEIAVSRDAFENDERLFSDEDRFSLARDFT